MNGKEIPHRIKSKCCQMILSDKIKAFQKCECGKGKFDTDEAEFYTRIIGSHEDYEIIE
jgi:hypothetical protein